jgi:hypothetical protein
MLGSDLNCWRVLAGGIELWKSNFRSRWGGWGGCLAIVVGDVLMGLLMNVKRFLEEILGLVRSTREERLLHLKIGKEV